VSPTAAYCESGSESFSISRTALGQRAKYETIVKAQVAEKLHDLRVM
jgi:hypothetical protein